VLNSSVEIADNLVTRAAQLVVDRYKLKGKVHLSLDKRIPMGAGMGTGRAGVERALVAVGVIVLIRHLNRGSAEPRQAAEDLLAERFARGEVGEQEYCERLEVLRRSRAGVGG